MAVFRPTRARPSARTCRLVSMSIIFENEFSKNFIFGKKKKEITDEHMVQRVIDLETGKDITGEYINQRLEELDKIADMMIDKAFQDFRNNQGKKMEIYKETYWQIHEKLGMGSIGPATAAAGPLMEEKKLKLAEVLEIQSKDLL